MLDREGRGNKEAVSIILNLPPDEKSLETTPNFSLSTPFTGKNKLKMEGLWISFLQLIRNNNISIFSLILMKAKSIKLVTLKNPFVYAHALIRQRKF
jgi:hypothetical protein